MTTLLITGGRTFCEATPDKPRDVYMAERVALGFALDFIGPSSVIVGDADGADRWAIIWCERRGDPFTRVPADWSNGACGGPERNQRMVDMKPDMGCAFPGGRGTADCTARMERAGIPVYRASVNETAP